MATELTIDQVTTDHGDTQWVSPLMQAAMNGYTVTMEIGAGGNA